jgi:hypothetical protein
MWSIEAPGDIAWPMDGAAGLFIEVYDWDVIYLPISGSNVLSTRVELCARLYPCNMALKGISPSASLERRGNGSIACYLSSGCSTLSIDSARILCDGIASPYSVLDAESATLNVKSVTFIACSSDYDGGGVRCYGAGGLVNIMSSTFNAVRSGGTGGAISAIGCSVYVSESIFRTCRAIAGGGAISGSQYQCYGSDQKVKTRLQITSCQFEDCTSIGEGGAILVSSSAASITVGNSIFTNCRSNVSGGALAAIDSATVQVLDSVLQQNVAEISGGGIMLKQLASATVSGSNFTHNLALMGVGGAAYASDAILILQDSRAAGNRAPKGAGGALFWDGNTAPTVIDLGTNLKDFRTAFCGIGNVAIYGECLASSYASLDISPVSTRIFSGLPFLLMVTKRDAYNQTILTDSESILQTASARDNTYNTDSYVGISGSYITTFESGLASFSIILKPSFTLIDSIRGRTDLKTIPSIYFKGLDAQSSKLMLSDITSISMETGSTVCPPGFVLVLDENRPGSNQTARQGACTLCASGTYSVSPLAGPTASTPACFNCFSSAACSGGYIVTFKLGFWVVSGGMYRLVGCPPGHELVNSIGGAFSHDVQGCISCPSKSYILSPNNSNYACQSCPVGAVCNGNSLTSRVSGAVWIGDNTTGIYRLVSCPPGYEIQSATLDGQQCLLCPATFYCAGGSALRGSCPDGSYSPPGTNASSLCFPVVYVAVALTLPLSQTEFTTALQANMQQALAAAAGVGVGYVSLSSISDARRASSSIQVRK